jgi:succinate dehydrogenase / fumarate reductase membrane anchor subunit
MGNGTSIGRVRGLGSSKHGGQHWLVQRFTAIANLLLLSYFAAAFVLLPNLSHMVVSDWLSRPLPSTLMVLTVISLFWHARLGLQVVVEDYVTDEANKFACLAALNLGAIACGTFGVLSVLRIALGAA